jgi:hypothetical protein
MRNIEKNIAEMIPDDLFIYGSFKIKDKSIKTKV